jgi:hypothetical protein
LIFSAAAISAIVAYSPPSNMSRRRNALAIALTMTLSTWRVTGAAVTSPLSGANTSFRPLRRLMAIGTRTVTRGDHLSTTVQLRACCPVSSFSALWLNQHTIFLRGVLSG